VKAFNLAKGRTLQVARVPTFKNMDYKIGYIKIKASVGKVYFR
jgi:hypothetical protein